jgi:transglutaminase-like putative cysteine protease
MSSNIRSIVASRRFLTAALFVTLTFLLLVLFPQASPANEKRGVVTVDVHLKAPAGAKEVRLWLPYPMSDENQEITDVVVKGDYADMAVYRMGKSGESVLYARWDRPAENRTLSYSFRVTRKEVMDKDFPPKEFPLSREEFRAYLGPTAPGPTERKIKALADDITRGKPSILGKSQAIYDWIVENMHRDPDVKGCGLGEVEVLLGTLGGKCADIHSVFVALARAAGVPAREIFGLRLPSGRTGEITRWQHCWAEFYLPGKGWVVVDPADVRKIILEKKITLEEANPYRIYYFGAVDANRVEFGTGKDVVLNPPQAGEPLAYFMYPYAEADGNALNEDLYGFNIGYTIGFRQM